MIVCALGLEESSGKRIRDTISRTHLVLDTDVVLELLGTGEPGNDSAETLVKEWRRHGGRVFFPEPVAEELAHHAWIADRERKEISDSMLLTVVDRRRYVTNDIIML